MAESTFSCETNNTRRAKNGQFVVSVPFFAEPTSLEARTRSQPFELRFQRDPDFKAEYVY